MNHLQIFEDYKLSNGTVVNTSNTDTKHKALNSDKMQKFLDTHNINATQKTFDEVQQIYHNFLRTNPEMPGVWGESAKDDNAWWMKGYK
jgi:hypothetical protein